MIVATKRYLVKNGNDPIPGNITEEKESELEEFVDYAILTVEMTKAWSSMNTR